MRRSGIYNTRAKKKQRSDLRNHGTPPEAVLWKYLRGRQLAGKKFRRQYGVGPFIVDFYCPECRLAVELDGASHFVPGGNEYDMRRTAYLNEHGIRVLRIENRTPITPLLGQEGCPKRGVVGYEGCFREGNRV